jgi:hypothetical protein
MIEQSIVRLPQADKDIDRPVSIYRFFLALDERMRHDGR